MFSKNNESYAFVRKTSNKYKISWKATNSVLANELLLREILKTVPCVKGRLLDIGCGEKPYLDIFSPHIVSYTGIDIPQSLHKKDAVDIFANAHHFAHSKKTPSIRFFVLKYSSM